MIKIENLTYATRKEGKDIVIFDSLSTELPTDRAFGILGSENSGKTTLMRLLSGFLAPKSGEILRYCRLSFPVGYDGIFQRELSPRDNLLRFSDALGRIHEVIEFVQSSTELGPNFDIPLARLSREHQLRFVFTATYALPFDCYLVDERFAPGEPSFDLLCQRMLKMRARDAGLILATSRPHVLKRFCESAAILDRGKIVLCNNLDEALGLYQELQAQRVRRP